jgi:hypothetical protein
VLELVSLAAKRHKKSKDSGLIRCFNPSVFGAFFVAQLRFTFSADQYVLVVASNWVTKFWWRKYFRAMMAVCCRVIHLAVYEGLCSGSIVTAGLMSGTSVDGDAIAGSTRSLRIELGRAAHSLHFQFGQIGGWLRTL